MASVKLVKVTRSFSKGSNALSDINFEVKDREVVTVLGPSGCGKSTLLRIIAGLDQPTSGEVWIGDRLSTYIPASSRDVAMVFQNYALYPHMNCYENLSLNLVLKKVPAAEIERRVNETSAMLEIGDLLQKKPRELSGGQRQRVALGRALIRNPKVFLFDEPLSNLDAVLRERVRHELKDLFTRIEATVIYVTHDQVEATTLADRTIVLDRGVIQQADSPDALYRTPANIFVASFVGSPAMNLLDVTLESGSARIGDHRMETGFLFDGPARIGIRPEAVKVGRGMRGAVGLVENLGARFLVETRIGGTSIMVLTDEHPRSDWIELHIDPRDIHVFDKETGKNLRLGMDGSSHNPQHEVP